MPTTSTLPEPKLFYPIPTRPEKDKSTFSTPLHHATLASIKARSNRSSTTAFIKPLTFLIR